MSAAKAARMIKPFLGTKRIHRIRMLDQIITQGTSTSFSLLSCDDDPNYDLTTDGANIAECIVGSRIIAIQLHMTISEVDGGEIVEWILGKDPDQALTATNFTISNLYTSDIDPNRRMLRENVWMADHMIGETGNRTLKNATIRIPSKTLKRSRLMADNDVIRLVFTHTVSGTDSLMYLRGRIITRGP